MSKLWEETWANNANIPQNTPQMSQILHIFTLQRHTPAPVIMPQQTHTNSHSPLSHWLSLSLSVSCSATSLSFAPTSWVPGLVGRKRSVDNCLLLPCHQTTLSHFTASLILRHPCQEMTFNFHTSSLCYSFFHEFYFWAHPKCIGCLAVSISLTVWESLTQMNTPTVFVFLPLTMYYD